MKNWRWDFAGMFKRPSMFQIIAFFFLAPLAIGAGAMGVMGVREAWSWVQFSSGLIIALIAPFFGEKEV